MTATHPPGWYPDPAGRHEYRYFDGTSWSPTVADGGSMATDPLEPVRATPARPHVDQGPARIVVYVALGAVAIAAFMPWVKASAGIFSATKAGTDGDGVLTLMLALVGAGLYALLGNRPNAAVAPLVAAIIAGGIGIYDLADVTAKARDLAKTSIVSASAGVGLYLTVIAAVVAFGASIVALRAGGRSGTTPG